MPMMWNERLDDLLLSTVETTRTDRIYWASVSEALSEALDTFVSAESARKRYGRLMESLSGALRATSATPAGTDVPSVPPGEFVGLEMAYWDLETTSLGAWTGHLLCASIADNWGRVQKNDIFSLQDEGEPDATNDRNLAVWVRDALERFDVQVAWNGSMFDMGFLNARLIKHGERPLRRMLGVDPRFKAGGGRYGLLVGSAKLKNVALFLDTPHQKPELGPDTWKRAEHGDREALTILQERCTLDALTLRDIFARIKPMVQTIHT